MKTELRIGNWVHFENKSTAGDFQMDVDDFNNDNLTPIPLTEEWLVKFGFKTDNRDDFTIYHNKYTTFIMQDGRYYFSAPVYCFKHVHQLQNLYFALTGKELIIIN